MENKYRHDLSDFVEALNLNKDKLIDVIAIGYKDHMVNLNPMSESILKMIKALTGSEPTEEQLNMFVAGVMFSQSLSIETPIQSTIVNRDMPFTSTDLIDSMINDQ